MFEAPRAYIRFVCSFSFLSSLSPYIYNIFAINPIQSIFRQFLLLLFALFSLVVWIDVDDIIWSDDDDSDAIIEPESLFHHHFFTSALTIFIFDLRFCYYYISSCVCFFLFSISSYLNRCLCIGVILGRLSSLNVFVCLFASFTSNWLMKWKYNKSDIIWINLVCIY